MKLKKQSQAESQADSQAEDKQQVNLLRVEAYKDASPLRVEAYKDASPLRIEAYSFFEFCQKVEQAINEGYKFDFDSNENFPQIYGSYLTCGMVYGQA